MAELDVSSPVSEAATSESAASESVASPTASSTSQSEEESKFQPTKGHLLNATTFNNKLGSDLVDILVGPEETLFRVHKKRLCDRIPFFEKMLNGGFKEASENVAKLPEDDPAAFDILVEWAYNSNPRIIRELLNVTDKEQFTVASWDAIDFYTLADKYCLPDLQDIIMDVMIRYHKSQNELPSADFAYRAYKQTGGDSPMSKYALKSVHHVLKEGSEQEQGWETEEVEKLFRELPSFAVDYLGLDRKKTPATDPRTLQRCEFHVHGEDEPCPPATDEKKRRRNAEKKKENKKREREEATTAVLARRTRARLNELDAQLNAALNQIGIRP